MKSSINRMPRLILGAIAMLFAGIIYAWSVLKVPLASELEFSISALALNFTLTLCFFCIGGVCGSKLTKITKERNVLLIAAALVAIGFAGVSRMGAAIIVLYIFYALFAGLGIGITYNVVVSSTAAWFPDKKGVCNGILMMCFGFSSLLLGKLADRLFVLIGWRHSYMYMGLAIAIVIAACSLGISKPGSGIELPSNASKAGPDIEGDSKDYTTSEMLKRSSFWRFFIFSILTSAVGSTVISFAKDLALSVGAAAALATTLVGVLSVCNGLGRIICGFVFDSFGRRKTMLISNIITIVAPLVIFIAVSISSLPLCIAGLCLTGICYGFSPTISSAFIGNFYGLKHFSSNYSFANLMLIPASFSATIANSILSSTGSYTVPILMLTAFAIIALILNISIEKA